MAESAKEKTLQTKSCRIILTCASAAEWKQIIKTADCPAIVVMSKTGLNSGNMSFRETIVKIVNMLGNVMEPRIRNKRSRRTTKIILI